MLIEWTEVSSETMPIPYVPVLATIESRSDGRRWVNWSQCRWNEKIQRWECYLSDGFVAGWDSGEIGGKVTHWAYWPEPAWD